MKRLSAFSNRHPFLSMFLGWLVLVLVVLVFVPADGPVEPISHVVSGRVS